MNKCYFWIFYVLLNARPMFKSMEYETPFEDKAVTLSRPHFKQQNKKFEIKRNLIALPNTFKKKNVKFKRKVTSKELDLKVFDKFETTLDSKSPVKKYKTSVENSTTSILPTLSTKIYKLHQIYVPNDVNFAVNKEKNIIFSDKNDVSTLSTNEDMEFLGTAEIEEILNDIKQREIQMIMDQEPKVTNLITNAVKETSFFSVPYVTQSNIFPGYAFSTFLVFSHPNNNLTRNSLKNNKRQMQNKFIRSIKEDSYTMACSIENKLQKKLKKTYCKLKAKLNKEYNKEIKESKATIKEGLKKMTKNISKKVCSLPCKSKTKSMVKTKLINKNSHKGTKFNTKNTKSMDILIEGSKFSTSTPKMAPEDEFSMLSKFERLLLDESNGNNFMDNVLSTQRNFENKDLRRFYKRNPKTNLIQAENNNENSCKDGEEMPGIVEYTDSNNNAANFTAKDNITENDLGQVTADANFQALSNKISFNDYVDGYKYYLNFQKDKDNEKYSNLVRYQAHKHHNVDDIGKFILKKIPRLPSTRMRRYFVESETLEDQDVSTKSEDSWFKKHFFLYLDTNPSRKFHTSQTVSLKASNIQTNELKTRAKITNKYKQLTRPETKTIVLTRRNRRRYYNLSSNSKPEKCVQNNIRESFERIRRKEKFNYDASYNNNRKKRSNLTDIQNSEIKEKFLSVKQSKHKICKKKVHSNKDFKEKATTLSSIINHRKSGFVNIDLVHRSTGIVKLYKNNKRKNKMQNLLKKLKIYRRKPKIIEKGKKSNRQQRHIFGNLKNFFREKPKNEITNGLKLFDYKIMTSKETPEAFNHFNSLKTLNIEEIWKQIPTITGDFTYPYYFLQPEVYNNEKLFYSRKPKLDLKTKSFFFLSGKSFPRIKENRDDVFNVNVKTDYTNKPESDFTTEMKSINNPTLVNMLTYDMKNTVDNINMKEYNIKEITPYDQSFEGNTLLYNNKISISNKFPFSKYYYDSDHFKDSIENDLYSINKHTQYKSNDLDKDVENKKTQSILARFSKNYITERYISSKKILKSTEKKTIGKKKNKNETKQFNKSVFEQWVPINKVTKICHTIPFPFSAQNHNGTKIIFGGKVFRGQVITPGAKNFKETAVNDRCAYTFNRSQNKGVYKTKIIKPSIGLTARVNAPPEQYFTTFLPMQINDFHKFLKEKKIDVESVTAPLINSLPRRLDTWNPKVINSDSKIKENVDNSRGYISHKPTGSSQSLDSILFQHQNQKNELQLGKSIYNINDHNQYDNFRSQKSVHDGLKTIKSVTGGYIRNIITSRKDISLTDIDLDSTMFTKDELPVKPAEKIKHQNNYFTVKDQVPDKDLQLYLSLPNKNRDPLRFSHMSTEGYFSKYLKNSKVTRNPERVQISGHSYKYDIIYHKPLSNNDERSSDDRHNADTSLIRNINNDLYSYSPTIEKPKVLNDASPRSHRGTLKKLKVKFSNSGSKKVKGRKYKLCHKKACKEDNQDKVLTENIKYLGTSGTIHEQKKQLANTYDKQNVYIEPNTLHKSMKQNSAMLDTIISKHEKRSAKEEKFTAKDVAALEVVVDLMKNTQAYDGKDANINAFIDNTDHKSVHHLVPMSPREKHVTNSIQVHIAIPYNTDDKKRSLEPLRLRKVFSAVMSTPVDLEYQIHSFEETTTTAPTSIVQDVLSPGLYLLVENTNITYPEGNFVLKPLKMSLKPSKLAGRYVKSIISEEQNNSDSSVNIERLSFDKDFVDAVNKVIQMNLNSKFNNTISKTKRSVEEEKNEIINTESYSLVSRKKRNINWNSIKKYFGHDKVCHCHCKANQTMCRECATCNAIVTELIFELENLAKYITQHCTEIQTFFWMNPSGGRKLRDVTHRIDKILSDYYRRVKGKCQGRTCQMLSTSIDKRSLNYFYNDNLEKRLSGLADDLENALNYKNFNDKLLMSGTKLLNMAKGCMMTRLHKRSDSSINTQRSLEKNIYSLSNIKVNLICNKDFTKPNFVARNTIFKNDSEKNTNSESYFDDEEIKKTKKNGKGIKAFFKNCSIKKKSQTKVGAVKSFIRNWRTTDKIVRRLLLTNHESIESDSNKVTRRIRESLNFSRRPMFEFNKIHKNNEKNISMSENYKIKKYTDDYKHTSNNEFNSYMSDKDSLSHNMNELFKLLNNVDSLETMNTRANIYLNQTKTKEPLLTTKTGTKTVNTLSKLKTKNNPKCNSKVPNKKSSSKTPLEMTTRTLTKSSKHRSNESKTKSLSNVTKLNFLNRLKLLEFLPHKDQIKSKINTPFNITSENRYVRSRISKNKNHKSNSEKVKNKLSQNDKNTNITTNTTSALLIIIDNDDSKFSDESSTIRIPQKKYHDKDTPVSSNSKSVTNSIQDRKVKPDNMKGVSDKINDTKFESLNRTLQCKSGTQKTTFKDYTSNDYNNRFQSLKNGYSNIFNYTVFSTDPKKYKGLVSKIADQFVIKILSDREIEKGSQKCYNCTYTTTSRHKVGKGFLQSVEKKYENLVSKIDENKLLSTISVPTPSTVTKTGQGKKKKEKFKQKGVQSSSNFGLREADTRNKVCDIASTVNYVVKIHNIMPRNDFEQYVKSVSCHKYKNMPHYIFIQYNNIIKNGNKKHIKYRRKCKKDYKNRLKWDWIRDKRSLIVDDTRIELDDYGDSEKFYSMELDIATHDVQDNNAHKNYRNNASDKRHNQSIEITTTFGKICDEQNQNYFDINGHRVKKRYLNNLPSKNYYQLLNNSTDNDRTSMKTQYYELYFKRKGGIYQQGNDRRKRSVIDNLTDLRRSLQNLPPLRPLSDEIFVTTGESISFYCQQPGDRPDQSVSEYVWNTEPNKMLYQENVVVNGPIIFLKNVNTRNVGTYICSKGTAVIRSIKVTITNIPSYNIVFTPVYQSDSTCTYQDLRAVQMLNPAISREFCGKYCSVRIDEPICLKDRIDDSSYIRPIVVISLNTTPNINCSCECKRNLQCSLARLLVSNMPSLAFVKVLISFDNMNTNKTLMPILGSKRRTFVTHTLRRKDSNGHYEYHNIAAHMEPGIFKLVLLCSAGFYLLSEQKICVVCPSNTFAEEGDNVCRICPQDTRASPGSRSCRLPHSRSPRFIWNANEWSIATFCALALSAFAICYDAIRLLRRACRSQGNNTCYSRGNTRRKNQTCPKSSRRCPRSPSHVILSRLLRGSLTSSQATDSQENRFELWKEKNILPPLPPIDFDL